MCATAMAGQAWKDRLAAELVDRTYPLVLRQGVKANSVDVELGVWKAIERALGAASCSEETPAHLTEAVYQVALQRGFEGAFVDLELRLWDVFNEWKQGSRTGARQVAS